MIQSNTSGIPAYMNVMPASNGYGGDGFGMGGFGGGWWMLMYFVLFAMMGGGFGGWGGNGANNDAMLAYALMNQGSNNSNNTNNDIQRGFDQQAVLGGINGVAAGVNGLGAQICNGFAQAEISANSRQMADMNQNYQNQLSTLGAFNGIQQQFAQCCCDQRLGIANLTSTILSENCADRNALSEAMLQMTMQNTANTQRLVDTIVGIGNNLDNKLCQLELDGKNDKIDDLQRQVTESNMRNMFIQYCGNGCTCGTCG